MNTGLIQSTRLLVPEELESLRAARIAFEFVMAMGEDHGFADSRSTLFASTATPPRQSFATREEADTWLATQPQPPLPAVVAIGGARYFLGYHRLKQQRVLIRLPMTHALDPGAT